MSSVEAMIPPVPVTPLPAPQYRYSPEEYLAFERGSIEKHEYFDGRIFAVVGASRAHNLITVNLIAFLHLQLGDRPFEIYPSDMRVKVRETGLYTYPDISVVSGEPQFADDEFDMLLNPTLIVEVLSTSTEEYDRGGKFEHYRQVPSLQMYLLVSQSKRDVELRTRQPDGSWTVSRFPPSGPVVPLSAMGCDLPLDEIYRRVSLTAES